jgi:predicted ATP-grasp superfamily ATP-dependent carboligase
LSPCPVFQRRIVGTPISAVFVATDGGAKLLGVTRQLIGEDWLGAHGFQYAGSIGPWPVSEPALGIIQQIGHVLAERFELVGLFGVDMIDAGDRIWTLEVNPRYTASVEVVERATGLCAVAAHAAACGGLPISVPRAGRSSAPAGVEDDPARFCEDDPARTNSRVHGKAILFAKRDVVFAHRFSEAALAEACRTPWPTLADVSPAGSLVESGRPIVTLFADGATVEEVERRLHERAAELEQQIYCPQV